MKFVTAALMSVFLVLGVFQVDASDWARFRGPNGSGIAAEGEAAPPLTWSGSKNMAWTRPLPGPGSSSPILYGDSVFVTCYSGYGLDKKDPGNQEDLKRHLFRINRADGKVVWEKVVPAVLPEDPFHGFLTEHGYASHAPVTDGERVYVFFGKSGVFAYDFDGKEIWKKSVGTRSNRNRWGSASSPILYKNLLIVNASDESRRLLALDKTTGKEVWKYESDSLEFAFGTPSFATLPGGGRELLIALPNAVWGLNPDTGERNWWASNEIGNNISPSLVVAGDVAYVNGGHPTRRSVAVRVGGKGDVTQTRTLWKGEIGSYVPSPVVLDGRLYGTTEKSVAYCVDAKTGKVVFQERLLGPADRTMYASVVLVGGRLYAVSRREGTFVFAPKPVFEQLAHNVIEGDDTDFNATPAVGDGRLYIRSNRALYCIGKE